MLLLLSKLGDDSAERGKCFSDPVGFGKLLRWKALQGKVRRVLASGSRLLRFGGKAGGYGAHYFHGQSVSCISYGYASVLGH